MKLTIAGAATATFAAVALATAPVAAAGPEEDFLSLLSDGGLTWPSGTTQSIIDGGYGVCTDWANGAEFVDEVVDIIDATGWSEYDAGFFVGAATGTFCPEFEYKVS
jgi:hypothetical protein